MRVPLARVALITAFAVACTDPGPQSGALRVLVATTGGDLDDDGYEATVDSAFRQPIATNGSVVISGVPAGVHEVALRGVAANCVVQEDSAPHPRTVIVTGRDTTPAAFAVRCLVTGVQVTVSTSGLDPDPDGYTVSVDGAAPQPIPANGALTITRLAAGSHTVALAGMTGNCGLDNPSPRSVNLAVGEVAPLGFAVRCVAATGSVQVTATTDGADLDVNGYTVQVNDGDVAHHVTSNGIVTIDGLSGASDTLWLQDVANNCTVVGDNPRIVSVSTGGSVRDTVQTVFHVTCVATTGALTIAAETSGEELDPNGYTVVVASGCDWWFCEFEKKDHLEVNGAVTIASLPTGYYYVWLEDVARNCGYDTGSSQPVNVTPGDTLHVSIAVLCGAPGDLQLTVTTTGMDADSAYTVRVNGTGQIEGTAFDTIMVVGPNATATIADVPAGDYTAVLDDVAANCEVTTSNPASATVAGGGTGAIGFGVTCAGLATVQLSVMTTGIDLDPDGYGFAMLGERFDTSGVVSVNQTITIPAVPGGEYHLILSDVAINCELASANPVTVYVPSGGAGTVTFDVGCGEVGVLAMTLPGPWTNGDVYLMTTHGTGLTQLTTHTARDAEPAWSPDGGRIAFVSQRDGNAEVYVVNADGSGLVRLTDNAAGDAGPAWSPDGSRIAFTSTRDGDAAIYVMNADGSGVSRLTLSGVSERQPAWSPDGSRLAVSRVAWCYEGLCSYDLYLVNADGSGVMKLTNGTFEYGALSAADPAWSPDGRWVAYGARHYMCYWSCGLAYSALEAVRADGGEVVEIVRDASEPAWRP